MIIQHAIFYLFCGNIVDPEIDRVAAIDLRLVKFDLTQSTLIHRSTRAGFDRLIDRFRGKKHSLIQFKRFEPLIVLETSTL